MRARAARERLGFGTSRRKTSARGGESPEALAWLPPALSWITRASPLRTQCYCTRAVPRCEPVATFEEKAVAAAAAAAPMITAQTRYAWEAGSREHDSHSKREMRREKERKRLVPCLEIITNIFRGKSSLSLRV